MVITRTTRNRLTGDEPVRGFESHRLRHERNLICLPNQVSFSYIRLRRVILRCSDIRLTPSDIALKRSSEGEYNITLLHRRKI